MGWLSDTTEPAPSLGMSQTQLLLEVTPQPDLFELACLMLYTEESGLAIAPGY